MVATAAGVGGCGVSAPVLRMNSIGSSTSFVVDGQLIGTCRTLPFKLILSSTCILCAGAV